MSKLSIGVCVILMAMIASEAWAKRDGPKPVAPVVHNGVRYVAPNKSGREGKVEARNQKTGEKFWDVVVYKVKIDPNLEEDVQWVFITGLEIRDNTLLVTNEKNERFKVDIKTRKVEKVKKDEKKQ